MKKLIIALAALVSLASCEIERDPSIVVQEMMNIQNGLLVNAYGVKYSIMGQDMASDIMANQRVFLTGTATPSSVAGYDYVLTPYEWYSVTVQDCVTVGSVPDVDEAYGTSPVDLTHVWFEGGYINALVTVSYDADEDFQGDINMVFDDTKSTDRALYFLLRNKQTGRTWEDPTLTSDKVVFGAQFYSFPYTQYYDSQFKGEQTVYMGWSWFNPSPYDGELPYRTITDKQSNYIINVL